jgi:hypothetical protein
MGRTKSMDSAGKINCRFFQQDVTMSIDEMDLLVSDRLCSSQTQNNTLDIEE